ncbi:hypothetical protein [Salinibacter ruber]|uniref:Transmembrane protein n=1 Tax=Salinibacter ruber TaxID=146919 RepID=A0AAW5P6S0_9BACT|nr:hypothetical protein [Salinibacter ruber]MCS4157751.1 hypothetical protein [Salinibacter ruber]
MLYFLTFAVLYVGGWAYWTCAAVEWGLREMEKPRNESDMPENFRGLFERRPAFATSLLGVGLFIALPVAVSRYGYLKAQQLKRNVRERYKLWKRERKIDRMQARAEEIAEGDN